MTPTARAGYALVAVAIIALLVPVPVTIALAVALAIATVIDVTLARPKLRVRRTLPRVFARGVRTALVVETDAVEPKRVELRQALPPDVSVEPSVGRGRLVADVLAHRRGETTFPPITARR